MMVFEVAGMLSREAVTILEGLAWYESVLVRRLVRRWTQLLFAHVGLHDTQTHAANLLETSVGASNCVNGRAGGQTALNERAMWPRTR